MVQFKELRQEFPAKVLMQNQSVLSLLDQFGNRQATVEEDFENVTFTMKGENLCEDC